MVREERSMFGSNGCLIRKAAATFGRIRIGPIQMGSFTNGGKEDHRIDSVCIRRRGGVVRVTKEEEAQIAVNLSRITPPLLPQILSRPRLLDLLGKHRDKRLTLILGQGAQGKTTLAADYVKESGIPSAWINLESEDSDPVNLFLLIIQSFQLVFKDIDFSSLRRYPLMNTPRRSEIPFLRERILYLYDRIVPPVQILIEDLKSTH